MANQAKAVKNRGSGAYEFVSNPVGLEANARNVSGLRPATTKRLPKRIFDLAFSGMLILALLPLMLLIAIALLIADGRPIFYRQRRIGRNGRMFDCMKFRTMSRNADAILDRLLTTSRDARREWEMAQKLRDDPRIHPLGRFLRRTSLDELPQFLNVLAGQMSVVGPRPITKAEAHRYHANFVYYAAVRPGITGLWQVSGRNSISYQQRVELDRDYVSNLSFARDLTIVGKTVAIVLKGEGDHQ